MKLLFNPLGFNPKGRRNLTEKEKEKIKEEYRRKTGKKTPSHLLQIDHKIPVALYKLPWWKDPNFGKLEEFTKSGRPKKHSYDRRSNLQALHIKSHPKKTKSDMKKILKKRKSEMRELGVGFDRSEIMGDDPFYEGFD